MTKKDRKTIGFALWYLICNSNHEDVEEFLEEQTESLDHKDHSKYIQNLIDKFK